MPSDRPKTIRIALCLLLLTTGASAGQLPKAVSVFHDDERGATSWTFGFDWRDGISCIRDSQLHAGNERQLSPNETQPESTPALAPGRWIDERYQL